MKKGLSILLLIIFLFNVGGYHIVYWGLRYQSDKQLTGRLDAGLYDRDQTIELKISVTLPYPIQSGDFERVNGRFEHEGEFYKLIKQKYANDTLHIICIRDQERKQITSVIEDYIQLAHGLSAEQSTPLKALQLISKLVKEFCAQKELEILHIDGFASTIASIYFVKQADQPVLPVHAPPPRS